MAEYTNPLNKPRNTPSPAPSSWGWNESAQKWEYGPDTGAGDNYGQYLQPTPDPNAMAWDPETFRPVGLGRQPEGRKEVLLAYQYKAEELAQQARNRYFKSADDSLMQGTDLFERYRPGGAASLAAGTYQQRANLLFNTGLQQEAPDLLGNYRRQREDEAKRAADKAAKLQMALGVLQAGATIAGAAISGGASLGVTAAIGAGGMYRGGDGPAPTATPTPAGPSGPTGMQNILGNPSAGAGGPVNAQPGTMDILGAGGPEAAGGQKRVSGAQMGRLQTQGGGGSFLGQGEPEILPGGGQGGAGGQKRLAGGRGPSGMGQPQGMGFTPFGADGNFTSQALSMQSMQQSPLASKLVQQGAVQQMDREFYEIANSALDMMLMDIVGSLRATA